MIMLRRIQLPGEAVCECDRRAYRLDDGMDVFIVHEQLALHLAPVVAMVLLGSTLFGPRALHMDSRAKLATDGRTTEAAAGTLPHFCLEPLGTTATRPVQSDALILSYDLPEIGRLEKKSKSENQGFPQHDHCIRLVDEVGAMQVETGQTYGQSKRWEMGCQTYGLAAASNIGPAQSRPRKGGKMI